ncbi:hypothetical protein HPP92_016532 [Vanilla planifolia]|uniref:PROP1-like PPR domain-containing protein n=1 Tax=Vanilla planifolia TaxID=51239 RepID=A0A835QJ11_VANPL|nr:hypothetical protein HPP92_016532 [Vanilla planifolia]
MDLCAEKGYWKEAENVFVATRKVGSENSVIEYNIMIKAFGKAKLYDKALEIFESMRCSGPFPDECTYNSIIQMLSGGDFPEKAREFLIQMRNSGFKPRCETFCSVITSYCRAGFIDEAVETYRAMNESNVKPNEHVYGSLIDAFAQSGRLDEAIEYYNIMEKSGIAANQIIITSMIKGYGKNGRWREAQELYAKLKTMGDGPDVVASNCMINLYAGLQMVYEAKLIFEELKRNGQADGVSYVTMMYLYKSMGMLTEAIDVAQELQQSVLLTNCESYTIVMSSYAVTGKLKDFGELLNHMLTKRILPDSFTFKTLFTVLRKGGFPVEAINQLESSYTEGKPYARQAVITSLFSVVGLHTYAMKSCEQFANGDVELESFAYNAAIGAYGAAGKVDKALNVFMRMQDKGIDPDVVTYIALAVCYGKAAMIEGLRRIYALLSCMEIGSNKS